MNALAKKNQIEYACIYVNELYLNSNGKAKGRLSFTKNCVELITGLEVILFSEKQKAKFK